MKPGDRIYVAGHTGLIGAALVRRLTAAGFHNQILRTHEQLDLTDQASTLEFFRLECPDHVFLAAARVGDIQANSTYPADFIRDNLAIAFNVIDAAHQVGVHRLMFFGGSCVYPRNAPQPMQEDYLLTGPLEPTNEPYAIAKIAGIKLCQAYHHQYSDAFFSVMPANLYGPDDDFDPTMSHVISALIRQFREAKVSGARTVTIWGTGQPRREFLHVDDLADAALFLMARLQGGEVINIGGGRDVTIRELAESIAAIVGYEGALHWDRSQPDGLPRKLLDVSTLQKLGWSPRISLEDGIRSVADWYAGHALLVYA
jgi:GDP-L-fucose synthase